MKKQNVFCVAVSLICLLFTACKEDITKPDFVLGKNRFTTSVDGNEREYFVHVPVHYTGKTTTPVVFMLHGTSGDGEEFYNISGWKEVGDDQTILTVYPSSLKYCITDEDGILKMTTKWNSQPAVWLPCPGVQLADDIHFFNIIIDELEARYNVDAKRIYMVGFSNGGQMAAKASVFMSDRLAAVVENASSFPMDTTWIPLRKLPTAFQLGNKDYGPGNTGPTIPLSKIDEVMASPANKPYKAIQTHIRTFGLSPNYTISGDTNTIVVATYPSLTSGSINDFKFIFVNGLDHHYPNGVNHWMYGAEVQWENIKDFRLP